MNPQIAVGQAEKVAGLTAGLVTGGVTGLTSDPVTRMTPARKTRRHYKPRARKCKCGCGRMVTPTPAAPHQKYFNATCRKRDQRRRDAKARQAQRPAEPQLEYRVCEHCGQGFFAEAGKGAKWCKPSHRTAAYEQRRAAAVAALTGDLGSMSAQEAADLIEQTGMAQISRYLKQQGYVYDEGSRHWVVPLLMDNVFTQNDVFHPT